MATRRNCCEYVKSSDCLSPCEGFPKGEDAEKKQCMQEAKTFYRMAGFFHLGYAGACLPPAFHRAALRKKAHPTTKKLPSPLTTKMIPATTKNIVATTISKARSPRFNMANDIRCLLM